MIAWSIAGSDSGGGAGIQADIKAMSAMGAHACTVITAVTAQNTHRVERVDVVSPEMFEAQLQTLKADLSTRFVKVGMLGSVANVNILANFLTRRKIVMVVDPVLVSTSGRPLLEHDAIERFVERILPRTALLTPNIPEAEALLNRRIVSYEDMVKSAKQLCKMGPKAVLIKGGHISLGARALKKQALDFFYDGKHGYWIASPRVSRLQGKVGHGTGCTLSAAITGAMAMGHSMREAIIMAKCYVTDSLRKARTEIGSGNRPVGIAKFPGIPKNFPIVVRENDFHLLKHTSSCPSEPVKHIGFYPIVSDRETYDEMVDNFAPLVLQYRHKGPLTDEAKAEIADIVEASQEELTNVYINDHWEYALEIGAYGVHLGQDDLDDADFQALYRANIRVGISTHDLFELARAKAYRPSYIALGPIFQTRSKKVPFAPKGFYNIRLWQHYIDVPLVVIGGIGLRNCRQVVRAGADGYAMISALNTFPDNPGYAAKVFGDIRRRQGYRLMLKRGVLKVTRVS